MAKNFRVLPPISPADWTTPKDLTLIGKYKQRQLTGKELATKYPKVPRNSLAPKPLTGSQLLAVSELSIDIINGRVYRWDGREVGRADETGRVHIGLRTGKARENRMVRRAHIIWWKAKGYWPRMTIDHKDVDCSNDRINNLREATMSLQNLNKKTKK